MPKSRQLSPAEQGLAQCTLLFASARHPLDQVGRPLRIHGFVVDVRMRSES
jgi:hypothetical protein